MKVTALAVVILALGIEEHGPEGFLATVRAAGIIAEWTE